MDDGIFLKLAARRLSGEADEDDLRELKNYFDADESFRKKFDLLKEYWEQKNNIQTDTANALNALLQQIREASNEIDQVNSDAVPKVKRKWVGLLLRYSAAAAIFLALLTTGYYIFRNPANDQDSNTALRLAQWQEKKTPNGAKKTITLADGTKVTMNADSKLKFPLSFSGNSREVYLSGEAFFDVTHNEKMPFIIHAHKMNIKVLGTAFNVKSYPEDSISETTLIRGLIEITLKDRPSDKIILRPKEKLVISNESSARSISSTSDAPKVNEARLVISNLHYVSPTDSAIVEISWLEDKLVFQDKSFGSLASDLERRYGLSIEFENETVKNFRFTGVFVKENIDQVLNALMLTEKFNYKKNQNKIIIY